MNLSASLYGCIQMYVHVCSNTYSCIQGVPEKRLRPVTFPESPALALKRRRLDAPKEENEKEVGQLSIVPTPLTTHPQM